MKRVISIDLGATNLRVGVVNADLTVGEVRREPTVKNDPDELYAQIVRLLTEVTRDVPERPLEVGVSACGIVSHNFIKILPNLGIRDFYLCRRLEKDFPGLSVTVANDANAAGFFEARHGAASKTDTSFFITVSSGIGGALVHERRLVDLPFEIGHTFVPFRGKYYECEKLLSGNGIVNLARLTGLEVKDAKEFFALVRGQDQVALKVYNDWVTALSVMIANIQLTYDPDVIVLSGGTMKSADLFEEDLHKIASAFLAPFPVKNLRFVQAKFDQDAGLMGGAGLALARLEA